MKTKQFLIPIAGLTLAIQMQMGGAADSGAQQALLSPEAEQALLNTIQQRTSGIQANKKVQTVEGYKPTQDAAKGEVIVRLKPGVNPQGFFDKFAKSNSALSLQMLDSMPLNQPPKESIHERTSQYLILLRAEKSEAKTLIESLKKNSDVDVVTPNAVMSIAATPNDPAFPELWGLENTVNPGADISAVAAWDKGTGSQSVVVGVIDTGVDYLHQDLVGNIWSNPGEIPGNGIDDDANGYIDDIHGINPVYGTSDPLDDHGHGTHVSGTIGAVGNNQEGVVGVNWNVKIAGCKFLDSYGYGYTWGAIACVNYFNGLKQAGVNIVATNNSWGGGGEDQILKDAIDVGGALGIVFVAAAGNATSDNDAYPHYPSSYDSPSILAVAATDSADNLAWFSNWGATSVDLAAPGQDILSTVPGSWQCTGPISPVFTDTFDNGINSWGMLGYRFGYPIYNDPNLWWGLYSGDYYSAPYSLSDSPSGDYQNYATSSAYRTIDLSSYQNQELCGSIRIKGTTESCCDPLYIYLSNDGGATWGYTLGTSGSYSDWTTLSFVIPPGYATSNFMLALVRSNDYSVVYDGYQVDNLVIGTGAAEYVGGYAEYSGTSMAAPHVTGAVALMASLAPGQTAEQRIEQVLNNVDVIPSMTDIVVTEGRLNLDQALPLPSGSTRGDFNGDGKPDILWRNTSTGANLVWYMNNATRIGTANLPTVTDLNWAIVGINDFNGDGKPDILWRNTSTGANLVWYMNNATRIGTANLPTVTDLNWKIVGTNDFNGDGKPDILWRNTSTTGANKGRNLVWYMNNATRIGTANLPVVTDLNWAIVGTNDFNGDGKPDILWRNTSTGADKGKNVVWYMNNATRIGTANLPVVTDLNWEVAGTNDFNGDVKPDILWRNTSTGGDKGKNLVWYMNNATRIGTANLRTITDLNWVIVGR